MRRTPSKGDEEHARLSREVERLRRQLAMETARADKAEREFEELGQNVTASFDKIAGGGGDDDIASLQAELKRLDAELEDARSHIFSLQPYRKDLTPNEVKRVSGGRPGSSRVSSQLTTCEGLRISDRRGV